MNMQKTLNKINNNGHINFKKVNYLFAIVDKKENQKINDIIKEVKKNEN